MLNRLGEHVQFQKTGDAAM
jgi:hypothetical protein